MSANMREASKQTGWETALARNTELFYEADRLETQAYAIIGSSLADAGAWLRFTEAKQVADAKRTEAYQDLMRIRRGMEAARSD
ncbi:MULTISPECIES: hypothetical protein [Pseudomonas]|uniref:hypothetical protein n=1 Tax=Pseudomonas TaxID=286 RepID=UPI002167FCDD|nr:hypothetical protein [Pseudomonas grimontii]MCS3514944.1 hypothetical protein [Pseudomonas grimontii]